MFEASEIKEIIKANVHGDVEHHLIQEVRIDSRLIHEYPKTLFICLKGRRNDGHNFIDDLIQKGVKFFVVESLPERPREDVVYFLVKNSLKALQMLAKCHRQRMSSEVLAITGSNGKTIVKEWLYFLLQDTVSVYRSPGSYNSQIGVSLSLLGIKPQHQLSIIEAGISTTGEMQNHGDTIAPDYGILTNLGDAHDSGFPDRSTKLNEKLKLMSGCKWWLSNQLPEHNSMQNELSWYVEGVNPEEGDIRVTWKGSDIGWNGHMVKSPFDDKASMQNLTNCLLFIEKWYPELLPQSIEKVGRIGRISMRTELRKGVRGSTLINDYYNSDLESMSNLLDMARQMNSNLEKLLILSDFRDIPMNEETVQRVVKMVEQAGINDVILVGKVWKAHKSSWSKFQSIQFYDTTQNLLDSNDLNDVKNRLILLKGARAYSFERIENKLARPIYGTRLNIDLSALSHNWSVLNGLTKPDVKAMVMVKASAYGSGSEEIARFYEDNDVDYLGVAYANEGVHLREGGVKKPIMVMNAEPNSWSILHQYRLEPEIHGLHHFRAFLEELDMGQVMKVHIKCETGMNRLGFEANELEVLNKLLQDHEHHVKVASIFTHLSSSDEPIHDAFTKSQLSLFDEMYEKIIHSLGYHPLKHAVNSSGLMRFPKAHYDMVRLGIGLYGCGIPDDVNLDLRPVHDLSTYIVQIRDRGIGDTIGYGRDGVIQRPSRIATIPLGYADGIPRSLGNGGLEVYIRGQKAKSIGRICMDMTMLDVTDIELVEEGDEVEIFGKNITIDEMAKKADTIPYEILVRLGVRVERVFTRA